MQIKDIYIYSAPRTGRNFLQKSLRASGLGSAIARLKSESDRPVSQQNTNVVVVRSGFDSILSNTITILDRGTKDTNYEQHDVDRIVKYCSDKALVYLNNVESNLNNLMPFTFENIALNPQKVIEYIAKNANPEYDVNFITLAEIESETQNIILDSGEKSTETVYFLKTVTETAHYEKVKDMINTQSTELVDVTAAAIRVRDLIRARQVTLGITFN
jgi:hypothetical protein